MAKPIAGTRKIYLQQVTEILRQKQDLHIREIQALLASKYNTQLKVSGALYSLRRDATKLLEAEGKQVPKYAEPRSMAIREAIRKGLREGKSYGKISAELKNAGITIASKNLATVASKMRGAGETVPSAYEQKKRRFIERAMIAGKGKTPAEIMAGLAASGKKTSSREFSKVRKKLAEKGLFPAAPSRTVMPAIRKLLAANPNMSNEEILKWFQQNTPALPKQTVKSFQALGAIVENLWPIPSQKSIRDIKSHLRKEGIPIPRLVRRRVLIPYTPEQQEWLEKNFAEVQRTIRNVCIRRNYSEEYAEGFEGYVYTTLPITMARYDAHKAGGLGLLGWVELKITKYARREFFHSWLMQKLSIGYSEATRLTRLLFQQRKGASVEEAASKLAISTDDANRLLSLYGKYKRFAATLPFNPDIGHGL